MERTEKILLVVAIFLGALIILLAYNSLRGEDAISTYFTTTTTTLPCIISNPAIVSNCSENCCFEEETVYVSADLQNAQSCNRGDTLSIKLEGQDYCSMQVIASVKISQDSMKISANAAISDVPTKCLGKNVTAKYVSLCYGTAENLTKISQTIDAEAPGNITFCAPKKLKIPSDSVCPIDYGELECFYGKAILPFYNPNEKMTIDNVKIILPKNESEVTWKLQSLKPNETKILVLENIECPLKEKLENFTLRWICENKFYEAKLGADAGAIETNIFEIGNANSNTSMRTGYPTHPTFEDCDKANEKVKNFCYDDAAEISGDEKICERISDGDIKKHCIARVTLNPEICQQIMDAGLKNGCLSSIEMKQKWLSEEKST